MEVIFLWKIVINTFIRQPNIVRRVCKDARDSIQLRDDFQAVAMIQFVSHISSIPHFWRLSREIRGKFKEN